MSGNSGAQSSDHIIYRGEILKKAVFDVQPVRESLVDSIIPKKSTTMFFAPDGAGKSTVILQKIIEASNALDVFGGFAAHKPVRTILALTERPKEEAFERIKLMSPLINLNWENIIIEDTFRGLDLMVPSDYKTFIDKALYLAEDFNDIGGLDYFFVDTIYGTVSEGLSGEKSCGQVNKMLRRIQAETGCAAAYTHHTNRGVRNKKTNEREKEDMYGNRFLSANCTGVFHLTRAEGGSLIEKKKDSLECLADKIELKFDPETYISIMNLKHSTKFAFQKIESFIHDRFKLKKEFTFDQILKETGVSVSYLRDQLSVHLKSGKVINLKPLGEKALYKPMRDF